MLVTSPPTPLVLLGAEVMPIAHLRVLHPREERGLAFADGGIYDVARLIRLPGGQVYEVPALP